VYRALTNDRRIAAALLVAASATAWLVLLLWAGPEMHAGGTAMAMPMARQWTPAYAALIAAMWMVMMAAMMLPSASPMILMFDTIGRRRRERGQRTTATVLFVGGYLLIWAGFAVAATGLQYGLEQATLLSMGMRTTSRVLAGAILLAAGLYQMTPLKQACLRRCRSPIDFVLGHWREGAAGAFGMGARHGLYCLGCCWVLMALLFVGGVMSLAWIGALAAYVLVEKTVPAGGWVSRFAGLGLIAWGGAVLGAALL
jgi:predicted metal-binding membrane protein